MPQQLAGRSCLLVALTDHHACRLFVAPAPLFSRHLLASQPWRTSSTAVHPPLRVAPSQSLSIGMVGFFFCAFVWWRMHPPLYPPPVYRNIMGWPIFSPCFLMSWTKETDYEALVRTLVSPLAHMYYGTLYFNRLLVSVIFFIFLAFSVQSECLL